MVIEEMDDYGHEQLTFVSDPDTGLEAIIAIHDTTLGPSLGGTRLRPYDTEGDALKDVMRLSQAMTYKAASADLDLGGGKAVIIADPADKTDAMMRAYGRSVDWLGGRYITSVDMNTGVADMEVIAASTEHVVGREDGLGDPSPITARGVYDGLLACCEAVYGGRDVSGLHVVVQGVGKVGHDLTGLLLDGGASVTISDVDGEKVDATASTFDVDTVAPEDVYTRDCDVFAPCAIGGVMNDTTIPQLTCDIVAGGANNVLEDRSHAADLRERGILYAPDYVINAGGLITVATEAEGGTRADALERAERIGDRLLHMIETAETEGTTVLAAADLYAEERIERGA